MDWSRKVILLTGGTGSFGQKFVEIMLKDYKPKTIRVFSRDELKQLEMARRFNNEKSLRFLVGDVRDSERLDRAMDDVDIVVHAAALKQVPSCEYIPFEAVKTNIIGAENIVNSAINHNVDKVLAISSDKAVNPVNLYGATKMCMEKLFIAADAYVGRRQTKISCARYGNVVGSRGSVVPLFKEQKLSGRITITDKRMTRFWITLEEGVRFVIQAIELMRGGEIFVPKIPSMKVIDLAKVIAPNCKMSFIGIRPGEKIHECLLSENEVHRTSAFKDFFIIEPEFVWRRRKKWLKAKRLPEFFKYTSDCNHEWLTKQELRAMVR